MVELGKGAVGGRLGLGIVTTWRLLEERGGQGDKRTRGQERRNRAILQDLPFSGCAAAAECAWFTLHSCRGFSAVFVRRDKMKIEQ